MLLFLFTLPLIGAICAAIMSRTGTLRQYANIALIAALALTLLLLWITGADGVEMVVGSWSPVSFTGAPLIFISTVGARVVLSAVLLLMIIALSQRVREPTAHGMVSSVIVFLALGVVALSQNLITLLIGIGLVDLYSAVYGIRESRRTESIIRDTLFHGASLLVLLVTFALYAAEGNSLYLPLAQLPARFGAYIMLALALRFGLVPLRAIGDQHSGTSWVTKASSLAGLLLMARLPQMLAGEFRAWFFGLLLITALAVLLIGALSADKPRLRAAVNFSTLSIAAASAVVWQGEVMLIAAIAWLIGTVLVTQTASDYPHAARYVIRGLRILGAACLLGLPLTIGFVGRAGMLSIWAARGGGGALLIAAFIVIQLLLTVNVLRLALWSDAPAADSKFSITSWIGIGALGLAGLLTLVLGISPQSIGAPAFGEILSGNTALDWLLWVLPVLLGAAAWWFEARWLAWVSGVRGRLIALLNLEWWQQILAGAVGRIARPLSSVYTFLESDGVLLWAVIVILIIVLVSRPGGP